MIRTLKELKNEVDERLTKEEIRRDEEGRVILEVTVNRDEDFLSDYSVEKPEISSEFSDFLQEQTSALPPKEPILLRIHSDCIEEDEKRLYEGALREHALRRYKKAKRDLKRNTVVSLIMFLIGFAGLVAVVLFSVFGENPVFNEILDIFAWVFVWEAVDLFFLERSTIRAERWRALRFYDAKIEFMPIVHSDLS